MGLAELKKELKKFDQGQLIDLVADLYKKNKSAKEFLDFYMNPDERAILTVYREKMSKAFYPKSGFGYNLRVAKSAISDFKKLEPSPELLADLMLFYVETGVKFTLDFGDLEGSFYDSMESSYTAALKFMQKENLLDTFAARAEKIVKDTEWLSWGFHDYVKNAYSEFYPDASLGQHRKVEWQKTTHEEQGIR